EPDPCGIPSTSRFSGSRWTDILVICTTEGAARLNRAIVLFSSSARSPRATMGGSWALGLYSSEAACDLLRSRHTNAATRISRITSSHCTPYADDRTGRKGRSSMAMPCVLDSDDRRLMYERVAGETNGKHRPGVYL